MFKFAGALMVLGSTVFLFSQKVLEKYFTYKFLDDTYKILQKIHQENSSNISYNKIFENIRFDYHKYIEKANGNGYINKLEIKYVKNIFENLGKHNSISEQILIQNYMDNIDYKKQNYFTEYSNIKKTHILCGIAAGLFVVILLI